MISLRVDDASYALYFLCTNHAIAITQNTALLPSTTLKTFTHGRRTSGADDDDSAISVCKFTANARAVSQVISTEL